MTQKGKCDTCRRRKVKCDEGRPICQQCQAKGRPCSYQMAIVSSGRGRAESGTGHSSLSPSADITGLQLVAAREAAAGTGMFQKFAYTQMRRSSWATPPVSRPLGDPSSRLADHWVWALGQKPANRNAFQIFGNIVDILPARLGTFEPLDLAANYLIDCHRSYRTKSSADSIVAQRSAVKAQGVLRRAVARSTQLGHGHILLCVLLLYIAELFEGLNPNRYVPHLEAFSRLVASPVDWKPDLFDDSLVICNYYDEVLVALVKCRDSIYDVDTKPAPRSPSSPLNSKFTTWLSSDCVCPHNCAIEYATKLVMMKMIQIPRLVRWLRTFRYPKDGLIVSKGDIVKLALDIYTLTDQRVIEYALSQSVTKVPTTSPHPIEKALLPFDVHFNSLRAFTLYLEYHSYRIIICGVLQSMFHLQLDLQGLDPVKVENDDIASGQAISMALNYALTIDRDLPLAALRFGWSVQLAYAPWHRRERRLRLAGEMDTIAYEQALHMRSYCLDIHNIAAARWGASFRFTHESLGACMDGCSGDKFPAWLDHAS